MLASVPAGNLRGDAKRGGTLYQQYCASCHGAGGHGDGPVAASLNPKPANHTDPARMGALSDPWVYLVITKGGIAVGKSPLMAPWGAVLTEKDTKDVIAFVRGLSGT
jgi:mono/diheme cytochrome c family protein